MASFLVILLLIPLLLRGYARRVEAASGEAPDKVHRIRRAQVAAVLSLPVLMIIMLAEAYGEGLLLMHHHAAGLPAGHHNSAVAAELMLGFFAVLIAGTVLDYVAVYPATARIRGLPRQTRRAGWRQARVLAAFLLPQMLWITLWLLLRSVKGIPGLLVIPLWAAFMLAILAFTPVLVRVMMPTKPIDSGLRQRLLDTVRAHKVQIKDVRCADTGPEQTANAMVVGLVPRLRYVLITDRLLRELDSDELEAVLAHELGHVKKHHLLIKLGAVLVTWLLAAGLVAGVAALGGHHSRALIGVLLALAMILVIAALLVIQGELGVRLEKQADDYASAIVGVDALRRGLEKLAAANAMKRRTGRIWNVLTQHPGIDQRIERLRLAERPQLVR